MSKIYQNEKPGYGKGRFVLGHGKEGVFGHVALFVQFVSEPGFCSIEWRVESHSPTKDAHDLAENAVKEYLSKYMTKHKENGLRVTIVELISDELRKNDYERAVNLALRSALADIDLPVPQIFGL